MQQQEGMNGTESGDQAQLQGSYSAQLAGQGYGTAQGGRQTEAEQRDKRLGNTSTAEGETGESDDDDDDDDEEDDHGEGDGSAGGLIAQARAGQGGAASGSLPQHGTGAGGTGGKGGSGAKGGSRRRGLTDADREHKRMKRLLRNRVSAQQARERKKQYLGELESRLSSLEQRHGELEERLSTLQRENFMLRQVAKNATLANANS